MLIIFNTSYGQEYNKTLDGVVVEAIELFPNFNKSEMAFGFNMMPFDAYYHGFGFSGSYTYAFNKTLSWEIFSGSYIFTVDKYLTSELAEKYSVNPKRIEKAQYVFSSNLRYVHSFGKNIFLEEYIHSYRSAFLFGLGNIATSINSRFAVHFGIHFDFFINKKYSWKIQLSDFVPFSGGSLDNFDYVTLTVLTGIKF